MAKEKKSADQSFEALLKRLEEVLDSLEHGELPLEQAMQSFAEGVGLVRACHQKLDEVERRVELLLKDDAGRFFTRPFPEEEGEDLLGDNGSGKEIKFPLTLPSPPWGRGYNKGPHNAPINKSRPNLGVLII